MQINCPCITLVRTSIPLSFRRRQRRKRQGLLLAHTHTDTNRQTHTHTAFCARSPTQSALLARFLSLLFSSLAMKLAPSSDVDSISGSARA